MNIPLNIIQNRKIISLEEYEYHQSLAKRLLEKRKCLENKKSKKIALNYTKAKLLKWFSNLNTQNRIKICSIYNNWLTKIIFQMITYVKFDWVVEFNPTKMIEEYWKNKKFIQYKDVENEYKDFLFTERFKDMEPDNFFTFFKGENNVKKGTGSPNSEDLKIINIKKHRENEFMKEIRFLSLSEFNDTLTLSIDLVNKPEKMMEYFNFFSDNHCFSDVILPIQEKNKNYNFSLPNWIYIYDNFSIHKLLIASFEQIISIYYQLYLAENEIPQFDIDKKFSELFQSNKNIEEYLFKIISNTDFDFINKKKIFDIINSKKYQNMIQYYENKTETVYSYAFASKYDGTNYNSNLKQIGIIETKKRELIELCKKNISLFVTKLSFIESNEAFLYPNFIYYILYQQLIEQCSNQYYKELLIEEEQKINNQNIKSKKKKKKRNKKKQINQNQKEEQNIKNINSDIVTVDINKVTNIIEENEKNININNNDNDNDIENEEEEIEEFPIDTIVEQKEEIIEGDLNNIASNNDINNSTVSSSYTNKCSKDFNSFGPKYNNFFRGDKKEEERLIKIEMEDLSEDKSEENKIEEKENEKLKIKVEDISENEVSEETIINEDISINIIQDDNKKKKKKNKKRNRKKKTKNTNNNNKSQNNDINGDEKVTKSNEIKNLEIKNENEDIKENKIKVKENNESNYNNNIKNSNNPNDKIKDKDKNKVKEKDKNKEISNNNIEEIKEIEEIKTIEEIKEIKNVKEVKKKEIEDKAISLKEKNNNEVKKEIENKKEEENIQNEKLNKRKKNKEFFLFPVGNQTKKKSNKNKNNNKNKQDNINKLKEESPKTSNKNTNNQEINNTNKKKDIIEEIKNSSNIKNIKETNKENLSPKNNNKKFVLVKTNETNIEFSGIKNKNKNELDSEEKITKDNFGINKNKFFEKNNDSIIKINNNNEMELFNINKDENFVNEIIEDGINLDFNKYNFQYNNLYYMNQSQYSNMIFYSNCNNSLFVFQNDIFSNLGREILDFEEKVDNNLKSLKLYREITINKLKEFITDVLKDNYEFEFLFYGSYSTGLSLEISDIDILIKFKIKNKNNNNNLNSYQNIETIISVLEMAFKENKQKLNINQINPIYTASVPVIKLECNLTDIIPENIKKELNKSYPFNFNNDILKLNFDFTFIEVNNIKEKQSIPSQEIIKYIKDVIKTYPSIRPILLVLKRFMQIKKLNSSFHGGISSYSLFLLLYAYNLKFEENNENYNYIDYFKMYLGKELLGFFSFYSNLDFSIYSIDVKKNNPINMLDKLHGSSILLIDPITGLNVAKSTFHIEQIKYLFNDAAMTINNFCYKNMNNLKNNEDYNILNELFYSINYNYNNMFIPNESSLLNGHVNIFK